MNAASRILPIEGAEALPGLYLGCPFWGHKPWLGNFYRKNARPREFLQQYSSVFNTVEGNTTFYSLPGRETIERWRDQTPPGFRFSFKFPQSITHQRQLQDVDKETAQFLRRIAPLGGRLGPIMLQFPRALSPQDVGVLWRFLPRLPKDFLYAVELRHPDFFRSQKRVAELDAKLQSFDCGRVIMDTRALRSGDVVDEATREALERKPNLPVYPGSTGAHPMIRFVGHPRPEVNEPWLEGWVEHLAQWIRKGTPPYFFAHCPDNLDAPALARRVHSLLSEAAPLEELPLWPAEADDPEAAQLELF